MAVIILRLKHSPETSVPRCRRNPGGLFVHWSLAALVVLLCVSGCSQVATEGEETGSIASGAARPADAIQYVVEPGASSLRVLVYRDGPLAELGHNHVIGSGQITGAVDLAATPADSWLQLIVDPARFEVDRTEWRIAAGDQFPVPVDAEDIRGTRANMLGERGLDVANHPMITITSRQVRGELPALRILAVLQLRGQEFELELPAAVRLEDDRLYASGSFDLRQTEIGLEPYSVMMGALAVRDEVTITYDIVANRSEAN